MEITPEFISELKYNNVSKEIVENLVYITENEPNDLLRVCARVWLQDHAVKLMKDFVLKKGKASC